MPIERKVIQRLSGRPQWNNTFATCRANWWRAAKLRLPCGFWCFSCGPIQPIVRLPVQNRATTFHRRSNSTPIHRPEYLESKKTRPSRSCGQQPRLLMALAHHARRAPGNRVAFSNPMTLGEAITPPSHYCTSGAAPPAPVATDARSRPGHLSTIPRGEPATPPRLTRANSWSISGRRPGSPRRNRTGRARKPSEANGRQD